MEEDPNAETLPSGPDSARVGDASPDPACGSPGGEEVPPGAGESPPGPAVGVWCAQCAANVVPTTPDHCPRCGRWLVDNSGHLTHGLKSKRLAREHDGYRVNLIEQLFAERGGREALDIVSRIAIESYALQCKNLKTVETRLDADGLFTQAGRRRSAVDLAKSISETIARCASELPPPIARPTQEAAIAAMPASSLHLAKRLLERQVAGEVLTAFEEGQLSVLNAAMNGLVTLAPDPADVPVVPANARGEQSPEPDSIDPITPPKPSPVATCEYCGQPISVCAEVRASRPDVWPALHWNHPDEVTRRNAAATATMMAQIGKPSPWL